MPFNGSGIYNLPVTTVTPAVAGTTIDDSEFNTFTADLKSALTNCIVKDGQTVSPILINPKILTKVLDTNGNEVLDLAGTASAVNNILIQNQTTGVKPIIRTIGEVDVGISFQDTENEQMLNLESVANAVNEVSITNAATAGAPSIAPTGGDVNIDLELSGKGTGDVVVTNLAATSATLTTPTLTTPTLTSPVINTGVSGTAGVRGIFILDNPETLYSSATYTSGAWTSSSGFASTTLPTAGATGAIVRLFVRMHWLTDTDVQGLCAIRKAGEIDTGIPTYINMQRANLNSNGLNQISPSGEGTVALDASSDFEFNFSWDTLVAPTIDQNFTVTLIGYYV